MNSTTFHAALLQRGNSPAYARKMLLTIQRAGPDPAAFLASLAGSATQATVDDYRNRLRIYAGWLAAEGHADEAARYEDLPRPTAAKRAQDRASFTAAEVRRLIECERIPAHRRAAYLVMAHLGLRPVEVQRLRAALTGVVFCRDAGSPSDPGEMDAAIEDARAALQAACVGASKQTLARVHRLICAGCGAHTAALEIRALRGTLPNRALLYLARLARAYTLAPHSYRANRETVELSPVFPSAG